MHYKSIDSVPQRPENVYNISEEELNQGNKSYDYILSMGGESLP